MQRYLLTTLLAVLAIPLTISAEQANNANDKRQTDGAKQPQLSWRQTDASLALLNHGRVVWQFNHLQDGSERGCPYFHPLATLDGAVLTDLRPDDHLWHRGLRFAWKKINGLEGYWTWPEGLERWPENNGNTEVTAVKVIPGKDYSARFELELSYHPPAKPAVLTEKRTILVSAPDKNGMYQIDWRGTFIAGEEDAVLDRTPILGEEGGKAWGGYAGLQLRVTHRKNLAAWTLVNSDGVKIANKVDADRAAQTNNLALAHGKKARWMDVTLDLQDGKTAGVALFDHPANLRHPAVWHVSSMPNELIQTPLFHGPYTVKAGKSLTVQYRIVVHSDRVDRTFLDKQWKAFTAASLGGVANTVNGETVRVAAISLVPKKFDLEGNADRLERAFRTAADGRAQIAVAPEGVLEGYVVNQIIAGEASADRMRDVAVTMNSPIIQRFECLAQELKMCLVFGFAERIEDDVFNCAVFIDDTGTIRGKYHKMQFAEGYHSSWWYNRLGKQSRAFDTPYGRCGLMICNDRWNPALARIPALDGAQFLLIPAMGSTSTSQDKAVLERGKENAIPVVEANVGVTLVVNDGQITAIDHAREGITFGEITIPDAKKTDAESRDRVEREFLEWRVQEMVDRYERTMTKASGR